MKRSIALLTAVPVLALASFFVVGSSTASAAPSPTPNGLTGAMNMINANAAFGMTNAMSVNIKGNGNTGMYCAVFVTNGWTSPS